MTPPSNLEKLRALGDDLKNHRDTHPDDEAGEEAILTKLDDLWHVLTDAEKGAFAGDPP